MRQYFYLVAYHYDECTVPCKVFLQEHEAITWGRKKATKLQEDHNYEVVLYKQEITRAGELEQVRTLKPYPKEPIDLGKITKAEAAVEPFDWSGYSDVV